MNSSKEEIAFGLTAPAILSFIGYGLSQWLFFLRVGHYSIEGFYWFSFWSGVLGIITSLICLLTIRIQSKRILACQIFNALWLIYIFYSIATLGPIGMQR